MVHTQCLRSVLTAAGLALLAGACSDELAAPGAPAAGAGGGRFTAATGQPPRVSNTIKYRDAGARPASGRSGSATLTARALLGKDGATELEVAAGVLDGAAGPATLEKVQVKQFAPDGTPIRTLNHNAIGAQSRATISYTGLVRGGTLQVQGNVREPGRTGVVTVTETVHLRPDLRVSLNAPSQAAAGLPVSIAAVVAEANGEVGARADCVLYVDGAEADRASGIWVDAGGVVTCAFSHVFTAAGPHALRVEASGVSPGDFDPANNQATGTLQVAAGNDFYYQARVADVVEHTVSTSTGIWEHGTPPWAFVDHHEQWTYDILFQEAVLYAWIPTAISLPLTRIDVLSATSGVVVNEASFTDVSGSTAPGERDECAFRGNDAGMYLTVCTSGTAEDGETSVTYMRVAGDVTYHSQGAQEVWYGTRGDGYYYTFNYGDHYTYGDPLVTIGGHYSFSLVLADGDRSWTANATVALGAPETLSWTPYPPTGQTCGTEDFGYEQVFHGCRTYHGLTTTRRGEAWGAPE